MYALTNAGLYRPTTNNFINDDLVVFDSLNQKFYSINREDAPYNDTRPYY
jgi:hypothetical protein